MKKYPDLTSMNISLTRDQREYVSERVAEHGYGSASEYMRALIRKDKESRGQEELERKLLEGLDSGPMEPFRPGFFEKLRKKIDSSAARAGTRKSKKTPLRKARRR